ncbi:MAG TPA: signal recognition particle-docking protein FtsY [Candidatus Eisenbacteria bacterium]|jgi:fused signal recognition particle receptor|nr:signal recognition particle-docking protein FtsY [Candidatus Eisenbacteria bacterium]
MGIFDRIREGLKKTREAVVEQTTAVFLPGHMLTDEDYESLEAALLRADVGLAATDRVLEGVRRRLAERKADTPADAVRAEIEHVLDGAKDGSAKPGDKAAASAPKATKPVAGSPNVVLVVGVNGTGKTTTIAKLARHWKAEGEKVLLVACDTFRAAASDQLQIWADRVGVEIHRQSEGADPAAVAHDGMARAKGIGASRVIIDTAGRLHVKANLMAELDKIRRVIDRVVPGAPHETLLVLDATTGQNGLAQVREFQKALPITGLVLTKLDGTAKGGVALAIAETLKLPIRWVGVGEGMEDLIPFDSKEFAAALVG